MDLDKLIKKIPNFESLVVGDIVRVNLVRNEFLEKGYPNCGDPLIMVYADKRELSNNCGEIDRYIQQEWIYGGEQTFSDSVFGIEVFRERSHIRDGIIFIEFLQGSDSSVGSPRKYSDNDRTIKDKKILEKAGVWNKIKLG